MCEREKLDTVKTHTAQQQLIYHLQSKITVHDALCNSVYFSKTKLPAPAGSLIAGISLDKLRDPQCVWITFAGCLWLTFSFEVFVRMTEEAREDGQFYREISWKHLIIFTVVGNRNI